MSILENKLVVVTGASGVAGRAVCALLAEKGANVRPVDVAPPANWRDLGATWEKYQRCDTRTPTDVRRALEGAEAVVHLAAWHPGHRPHVSDETFFAVNVDGTFNVVQEARANKVETFVFASSMAYGFGGVYSVTKVIGEDLTRMLHQTAGTRVANLRYHAFVPMPYLQFGELLLRNGVDVRDVTTATVASVQAGLEKRYEIFTTIVHTNHGLPEEVRADFATYGPDWCEAQIPGAAELMRKYELKLPKGVEQHDLSEAAKVLDWRPEINFLSFLRDLRSREGRGEDVRSLWAPGQIPS